MKKTLCVIAAALSLGAVAKPAAAQEFYLGQIILGGWNFCPRGTADAAGQLLPISQFSALFSLYGTQYGGDGRTTFALPDLRGRSAMNQGHGPGLSNFPQGARGGDENTTLNVQNMPPHNHALNVQQTPADQTLGAGNFIAGVEPGEEIFSAPNASATRPALNAGSVGNAGGGVPFTNRDPYLALRYCVVTQGIFPSRG